MRERYAAAAALVPALLTLDEHATAALRNLAGLGGLAALGAVLAGPRLAWVAPAAWAFAGAAVGPRSEDWLAPLTSPVQAGDAPVALALAGALGLAGAALHATLGVTRERAQWRARQARFGSGRQESAAQQHVSEDGAFPRAD